MLCTDVFLSFRRVERGEILFYRVKDSSLPLKMIGYRTKGLLMRMRGRKKEFLLLFTGILLVLGLWGCAGIATPQSPTEPASPTAVATQEVQRVTLEESKMAFDNGSATFVDVRPKISYEADHVPGALSIPLAELKPRIAELDPSQWIITYCT